MDDDLMIRAVLSYVGCVAPQLRAEQLVRVYNIQLGQAVMLFQVYHHFPATWMFDVSENNVQISTWCTNALEILNERLEDTQGVLL